MDIAFTIGRVEVYRGVDTLLSKPLLMKNLEGERAVVYAAVFLYFFTQNVSSRTRASSTPYLTIWDRRLLHARESCAT